MSGKSWDDLVRQVQANTAGVERVGRDFTESYDAPARREDGLIRQSVDRLASFNVTIPLGALTALRPEIARVPFTFSASYATGGEDVGSVAAMVHDFQTVEATPQAGYTFQYVSGTNKLKAFSAAATEVVATTNLQVAIGDMTLSVIGAIRSSFPVYRANGDEIVSSVTLVASDDLTASPTNYWTFRVRRRANGQEYGQDLNPNSPTTSTADLDLVANEAVTLYDDAQGYRLGAGDDLLLLASATGSYPPRLDGLFLVVTMFRKVT